MMRVQVDQSGLAVRLSGLDAGLRDLRPVWNDVSMILTEMVKRHLQSQGSYSGETWVPLSPRYAAWKRAHYPGKPLMRLRDRLYKSLTTKSADHVDRRGPSFFEWGTKVPYARAHHWGWPPTNLPVRKVIPRLTRNEGEQISDAILAHLLRRTRRGGR